MAKRGERTSKGSFDSTEKVSASDLLGPDCKVRALGFNAGINYLSDTKGQMRALRAKDMTVNELIGLFGGDVGWLEQNCGTDSNRKKKQDNATWHNPTAVAKLIKACNRAGIFDPAEQIRGPGLWPLEDVMDLGASVGVDEQIVIHTGDQVGIALYDAEGLPSIDWSPAGGKIGSFVYASRRPKGKPADIAATEEEVAAVRSFFGGWNQVEPELGPMLLLGITGLMFVPALTPYRSGLVVQGPTGSGKSALTEFMWRCTMHSAATYDDSTWAKLGDDFRETREAKAVILNEAEREQDNRRLLAQIKMATLTYKRGEGRFGRSGKDDVMINANFIFGAISPPPLRPQDANRLVIVRLRPLEQKTSAGDFEAAMVELGDSMGPKLMRRMLEQWPRFKTCFATFREGLLGHGHVKRSADTYGTVLAIAHLLSFDGDPISDDVDHWCELLDATRLSIRDNQRPIHEQCLMRLMTFPIEGSSHMPATPLGDYIRRAVHARGSSVDLGVCRRWGVSLVSRKDAAGKKQRWVAVSNSHEGLEKIFRGTAWAEKGWLDSLRETPGAIVPKSAVWFGGAQDRATLLPIACFPQTPNDIHMDDVEDMDSDEGGEHAA